MSKTRQTLLTVLAAGVLLLGADIYQSTSGELPVANAETVRTTRKTKVMARPGEKGRVLTRVNTGTKLTVLARKGRWLKVRANGRTGWITRTSAAASRSARKDVRRTRRRAFVEGRSTRRGWSGSAPSDRVGADATDDEEILEEEVDEPAPRKAKRSKRARKSKSRTAARDDDMDDMDEDDFEDDFEDDEPAERSPKVVKVSVVETELLSQPSGSGKNVAWAEKGQKLMVIETDGDWMLVESPDGDEGWVRSDDVSSAGFTYPKTLKRGSASLGYTSMGSLFASDGNQPLSNYKITTAAASLAVGGDYLYRYSDTYIIGVDARYIGTRASPGIRYVDADGNAADIGFLQHEIMVKAVAGYNMQNDSGTVAYGRLGYHYGQLTINNVGDFTQNLAYLPSEILQGITVGAALDMPRLREKIGARLVVDALYPSGKRTQTQGLEDGAVSSVFAAWVTGHVSYQWKENLTLDAIYRYSYAKTDWQGAAMGSMRPTGATTAARKDVGHNVMVGVGRNF